MSEKQQRIQDIWNWLPAFRAVAETEHLPTASSMIHLSTSALSRAVGQLEDYFGHELFDRRGRGMELNDRGERLLQAVRRSMRSIDDAIERNLDEEYRGPLNWTSSWSLSSLTLEALDEFTAEHPAMLPKMHTLEYETMADSILQGDLDLAVVTSRIDREGLTAKHLGKIPHSVYCGSNHRFHGRENVTWDELEKERYAAPMKSPDGQYHDGWPPDRERNVVMELERMAVGYRACRDHGLLAVLPDIVTHDEPGLWRLARVESPRHAFALFREPVGEPSPAEEVTDHLAEVFARRTATESPGSR